jgi:chloramphenicol O-acetyltransferase type A
VSKRERVAGGWIDLTTWKRRDHYRLFRRYAQPCFSVTVDVDVTRVWKLCRKPGAPTFFLTSLFLLLRAVNGVEAFRLRLRPRGVWRHNRVGVGATIRRADDTFAFARLDLADDLARFIALGAAALETGMHARRLEAPRPPDDVVYHSVLPWFRFTGYTNALPGTDSIPRIVFGRAVPEGGRMTMPVAVEVHHALVDGLDVAKFFDRFKQELRSGF